MPALPLVKRARAISKEISLSLSPHLVGEFNDLPHLRPLLILDKGVAFLGRGETALRRQAALIERNELARLVEVTPDVVRPTTLRSKHQQ